MCPPFSFDLNIRDFPCGRPIRRPCIGIHLNIKTSCLGDSSGSWFYKTNIK